MRAEPLVSAATRGRTGAALAIDLGLRLTLLDLLLRPVGNWALRPFILGLAVIGLLRSGWLRHPLFWLALAGLTGIRCVLAWPLADNHAYLLSYWCLAVALALMTRDASRNLAVSGRALMALVFAFACLWKFVLSEDYVGSSFLQVTFLTDPRFEGFARVAGGLDVATYDELRGQLEQHRDTPPPFEEEVVGIPARIVSLAVAATIWNLFINAALAVSFAWPGEGRRMTSLRHLLLLLYCIITYAIATVDGFGWLLLAMGASLCAPEMRRTRLAYMAVFVMVLFYREVPWADNVFLPLLG